MVDNLTSPICVVKCPEKYLSIKEFSIRHLAVNISSPKVRELHDDFLWRERALDDKINRELIVLNYDFFLQDFLPKLLRTNHGLKIIKSGERVNGQIKRRKVGKQGYLPHCYSDKGLMSTAVNQDYSCDCNGESITTSFNCRYFYLDLSL